MRQCPKLPVTAHVAGLVGVFEVVHRHGLEDGRAVR